MKLSDFTRGWLVGDFDPSLIRTKDIEVAVQEYKEGDVERPHIHKEAIEYNLVIEGLVSFNDRLFGEDDIAVIEKGEESRFKAITDAKVLVIKTPSLIGDKYYTDETDSA